MTAQRGLFITVEGGEGVGKSTNIEVVKSYLEGRNIDYVLTREPGGTLVSEAIRQLVLDVRDEPMDPTCELLLIFAARAQHLNLVVEPALKRGQWVLCDRFTDATYAYQGAGRNLDESLISELEQLVQKELRPDLTIVLDLDPEVGLARARKRGELDRIENEQLPFFRAVRECYLSIASRDKDRCMLIDAAAEREQVREAILLGLEQRLGSVEQ